MALRSFGWKHIFLATTTILISVVMAFWSAQKYDLGFPVDGRSLLILFIGWVAASIILGTHRGQSADTRISPIFSRFLIGSIMSGCFLLACYVVAWGISVRD